MYLVSECTTRSAPCASGRCSTGVANVASTDSSAPASCAIAATASTSVTRVVGLAGVSTCTSRVCGRIAAARTASRSAESTSVAVMPYFRGKQLGEQPVGADVGVVGAHDVVAACAGR